MVGKKNNRNNSNQQREMGGKWRKSKNDRKYAQSVATAEIREWRRAIQKGNGCGWIRSGGFPW